MKSVIEHFADKLSSASVYNSNTQIAPVVTLWTDKEKQWVPVLSQLQELLPELLIWC